MIKWRDEFSVHILEIDAEHRQLFALIDQLRTAMKEGRSREVLGEVLNGLVRYAAQHFDHEERIFEEYGYPDRDAHKLKHDDFVEQIGRYDELFHKGSNLVSVQLISYLSDWLVKHIRSEDQRYARFLAEIHAPCTA